MIIIPDPDKPYLRDTITLEPTFGCVSQTIGLRAFRRMQFLEPGGEWSFLPDGRPAVDISVPVTTLVDLATMQIVQPEDTGECPIGAAPVVGLMVTATAGQIGLTSLSEGSIYEAMAGLLERYVTQNGLVP